jgi:uncharacterized membrane protein
VIELLFGADLGPGSLVFDSPAWAIVSVLVALGLGFALAARGALRVRPAGLELGLLALAMVCLAWVAAAPVWVEDQGRLEEGRLVVLVDDSRSMAVLEDGQPRHAQVERALAELDLSRADRYLFGEDLLVGDTPGYLEGGSDLGRALEAVRQRHAGERLSGIVVITDGIDRGGLRRELVFGGDPGLSLPGPLTLYQVGEPGEVQDLAITGIDSGGFAFLNEPFTIDVRVQGSGRQGQRVPVLLSVEGHTVSRQQVELDAQGQATASFTLERSIAGRVIYEASVPVEDSDAVPGNNSMPVAVRVVRDKLRVLQVCGSPSFDEKFLRLFLKQDPGIDLVSFFILRTNDDLRSGYGDHELSLIRFPYRTLFEMDRDRGGELDSFDLVIFQNFDYASFFRSEGRELLGNIERFVRSGKAFVMIGGDRSFDLGEYQGTPIEDILPVRLGVQGGDAAVDLEPFQPSLTEAGRVHPVTRLLADGNDNEALWGRLPPLDGANLSRGLAPGSASLLNHPSAVTEDGSPAPVLAVREVDQGRTMALMGDSSWRWVMTEAAESHGNQAYLRFWKNAIRWLVKDREGQRVKVETTHENYRVGEKVRVVARVRDVGFQALEGVPVRGEVTGPGSAMSFEGVTDANGEAIVELEASQRGAWTVALVAGEEGGLGRDGTRFAVTDRDPELEDIQPAEGFLSQLATTTGGLHYRPGDYGPPRLDPDAGRTVKEVRETPLWSSPLWALLAGLALSVSWWLRRRRGLR